MHLVLSPHLHGRPGRASRTSLIRSGNFFEGLLLFEVGLCMRGPRHLRGVSKPLEILPAPLCARPADLYAPRSTVPPYDCSTVPPRAGAASVPSLAPHVAQGRATLGLHRPDFGACGPPPLGPGLVVPPGDLADPFLTVICGNGDLTGRLVQGEVPDDWVVSTQDGVAGPPVMGFQLSQW
jgi:hypothetical protein